MTHPFLTDNIWLDKWRVDDAERVYYERKSGVCGSQDKVGVVQSRCMLKPPFQPASAIAAEIAKARSQIRNSLKTEVRYFGVILCGKGDTCSRCSPNIANALPE